MDKFVDETSLAGEVAEKKILSVLIHSQIQTCLLAGLTLFAIPAAIGIKPLVSHGMPWKHSTRVHCYDTRRHCRNGNQQREHHRVF